MRYDAFISYCSADYPHAQALESRFRGYNLSAFVAPLRLEGGARWREELRAVIRNSREFVVLVSKASMASQWVLAECGAAWGFDKTITPILIEAPDRGQLPDWLDQNHWLSPDRVDDWLTRFANPRGWTKRFPGGEVQELELIEVATGQRKPVPPRNRYAVRCVELHLGAKETILHADFAIGETGPKTPYKLVGHGPPATSFADLEYRVYEGERPAWGGVICLYTTALPDSAWRGYWMARYDELPGHIVLGSVSLHE